MASRRTIDRRYRQALDAQDRLLAWADDEATLRRRAANVSQWWIGLHVEHLGKTAQLILEYLERFLEVGGERGWQGPNAVGWMVLLSRFIPRGRAEVPDFLAPDEVDAAQLRRRFVRTREGLIALGDHLDELARMRGTQQHPLLGHFTVLQWIDFLVIHDHHHYKIIRDIERELERSGR